LRLAGQPRTRVKSSRVFRRPRLNATPRTPASSPSTRNIGKVTSGGVGADATWNTGSWLVNERVSTSAVTAATNAAPKTAGAKCRWSSSRTNVKPARGALKAAASPAPAPAAIKVWRSRGDTRNQCATAAPNALPSWTVGPSRPSASPLPIPTTPPTNFTRRMACHRMERNQ
jgi:hypothetical protein